MSQPGIVAAFAGGLLSFLSPCVLPLVPGYISFISGFSASGPELPGKRRRIISRSLLFIAGFTTAFTILGMVFSGGALFAGGNTAPKFLGIASGALIFLFGLNMIFDFLAFLQREFRFHPRGKTNRDNMMAVGGPAGAFAMGLAFAAGWSPCVGPILASILLYAGKDGSILRSAFILGAYSLGLAIPFLAAGIFFERLKPFMDYMKRHGRGVRIVSGLILMAMGAAMAAGSLPEVSSFAVRLGYALRDGIQASPGAFRLGTASILAIPAIIAMLVSARSIAQTRRRPKKLMIVAAVFALSAILQLVGIVDLASLIADWLLFSGA